MPALHPAAAAACGSGQPAPRADLEREERYRLEPEVCAHTLCDFANQTLERKPEINRQREKRRAFGGCGVSR